MSGNISFNPMVTTGAANSFVVDTNGFVQGTVYDDPGVRYQYEGGQVASGVAHPVWGGLPISLAVPQLGQSANGPPCSLATANANIEAWVIYNQAAGMIVLPGSTAPVASPGMSINFVRPGSLLRLALQVDPAIVNSLVGGAQNQQVSWDFTNNRIMAYSSGVGALPVQIEFVNIASKVISYNSSTGAVTWNDAGPCAVVRI